MLADPRQLRRHNFFVKPGYQSRTQPSYFVDDTEDQHGIVYQPDVYEFVARLGNCYGSRYVVDLGCGRAKKLVALRPRFELIGVDFGENIEWCRSHYDFGEWIPSDFEAGPFVFPDRTKLRDAIPVCSDVLEHLLNPTHLLRTVRDLLEDSPVAVLTTPKRDLIRGPEDMGPPANPHHVREWNRSEFTRLLEAAGLQVLFQGLSVHNSQDWLKRTILAVVQKPRPVPPVPPDFRVLVFICVYNEEDVIIPTLDHLIAQGVEVHIVDNWSKDRTVERVEKFLGRGVRAITRFPEAGPTATYDWHDLLRHVEILAHGADADWVVAHDADEVRESPWPELTLREAIYRADQSGFNAIDHTALVFHPTGEPYSDHLPLPPQFRYFEFGKRPAHFLWIKGWRRQAGPVELAWSGGHEVRFPGRRVYPFRFLLRHYPIRTQEQGERKVFADRLPRFNRFERLVRGWHTQYNDLRKEDSFIRDPTTLTPFDEKTFYQEYLVERLSGVGILR